MKPLLLKIEGLNSYEQEVEINFEMLISGGIFGIFGATGSGKSTIIDAITMSLYGEMSRYTKSRGKQCININSNTMSLYFKFLLKDIIYIVTRTFKKHEQSIKTTHVRLSKVENDKEVVLGDQTTKVNNEIKRLLGLTYDDFLRSVILPQGKFSEFLNLENKDRADMLERIFKLERYGASLNKKISEKNNKLKTTLETLNNKKTEIGHLDENTIDDFNNKIQINKKELEELKINEEEIIKKYEEYLKLNEIYVEYKSYIKKSEILLENQPKYLNNIETLNKGEKANKVKDIYESYINSQRDLKKELQEIDIANKNQIHLKATETEVNKGFKDIEYKKENNKDLLNKENDLKRCLNLINDSNILQQELETLENTYKSTNIEFKKANDSLNNSIEIKETLERDLDTISEKKEQLNIEPSIREAGFTGKALYNKEIETKTKIKTKENEIYTLVETIKKDEKQLNINKLEIKNLEIHLKEKEVEINNLLKISPLTYEEIMKSKELYLDEEKNFILKIDIENKIEFNMSKIEGLEIDTKEKNIIKLKEERDSLETELKTVEENIENINNKNIINKIIKDLKENEKCPVCGSKEHPEIPNIEINKDIEKLFNKEKELKNALERNMYLEEINKLNILKHERELILEEIKILKTEIRYIYAPEEEDLEKEKFNIEKNLNDRNNWDKLKNILEKEYQNIKLEIQRLELYTTKNIEKIKHKNNTLTAHNKELEKLYTEKNNIVKELIMVSETIKTTDYENFYNELEKKEKELMKISADEKDKRTKLKEINNKIDQTRKIYDETKTKKENLIERGKSKRGEYTKLADEIKNISGERAAKEYLEEVSNEIKNIDETYSSYKEKIKKVQEELSKNKEITTKLEGKIETLKKSNKELEVSFSEALKNNDFLNEEDFLKCILRDDITQKLKEATKTYENTKKEVDVNINNLKKKLERYNLDEIESKYLKLKNSQEQIKAEIRAKTNNIIKSEYELNTLIDNLQKLDDINKQIKKLDLELDISSEMLKLFKGNAFVKFVAKKHLKYITIEASKRLRGMTNGRYEVELQETDFMIKDNFQGGMLRYANTLSGGEMFIVSLCLALSLSSKIQLNGSILEFFFLDEGFGTLDQDFIEQVMSSLESLRLEKLTVGIISHVKELQERINNKIIVINKAKEGKGTTIKLEF